jgi:hypothetical protein
VTNGTQYAKRTVLRLAEQISAALTYGRGFRVRWFDDWHPLLDEALASLPETDSCPHELFRLLVQNRTAAAKRVALVTTHDGPVALVGLRRQGPYAWAPVTQWLVPGAVCPAKPEYLVPALAALGVELSIVWWRMERMPPEGSELRRLESVPTHRMRCSSDYERYWRTTRHFKTVANVRNRCRNLVLVVNVPGSAEWTIRNWDAKWRGKSATVHPSLDDRLLAATYFEQRGMLYTLSLLDRGELVAGNMMMAHGRDLVGLVNYRRSEYNRYGVGDRLIDLAFSFAVERGFEVLDIGGGHDYKRHWAPEDGAYWQFRICPQPLWGVRRALGWLGRLQ